MGDSQLLTNATRPPRLSEGLDWIRLTALVGVILWGVVGAVLGVAEQRAGLQAVAIDCGYRVQLLRDRVVALMDSPPAALRRDRSDDQVSTLLRETQAACSSKDERLAKRLRDLSLHLQRFRERQHHDEQAIKELLAL